MRVCGVELKGTEAIICLLSLDKDVFQVPDCRVRKIALKDVNTSKDLKDFQFAFAQLMRDYKVDMTVIRLRPTKGKFAGGAIGFKLEAAIQLIEDLRVATISSTDIKAAIKRSPMPVPFSETGLKVFQEPAFTTAYAYLTQKNYQGS